MNDSIKEYAHPDLLKIVEIFVLKLDDNVGALGAAALAMDSVFKFTFLRYEH